MPDPTGGRPRPLGRCVAGLRLAALLALLGSPGCAPQPAPAALPPGAARNLVLVSLDTVRRDHLPTYGYARDTAPGLARLASGAAVFENAIAQETNTNPSHASMFTGLYPHTHGSLHNGWLLREDQVPLAEILREAGFATAGFVSGVPMSARASGLDRGFDTWDDDFERRRDGGRTVARALAWLRERTPGERFLLFVHLYDAHGPYVVPAGEPQFRSARAGPVLRRIPPYQRLQDKAGRPLVRRNEYVDRYDTLIRYQDRLVEGLLGEIDPAETIVVVLSDHGETFDERYWQLDHGGQVFDEQIRIPLIVRAPGFAPVRVAAATETVDLAPTLLELLGVAPPPGLTFQGRSLVDRLAGRERAGAPALTFSSTEALSKRHRDRGYELDRARRIDCVRSPEFKLIVYPGTERDYLELYRLAADPAERADIADEHPAEVARLLEAHRAWRASGGSEPSTTPEIPEELREQLRSLGYVD